LGRLADGLPGTRGHATGLPLGQRGFAAGRGMPLGRAYGRLTRGIEAWGRWPYTGRPPRAGGASAPSRMHLAAVKEGPLGLGQTGLRPLAGNAYRGWVPAPELPIKGGEQAAGGHRPWLGEPGPAGEKKVSLEDLITNYVEGHRKTYVSRGWQHFKAGRYRQAYDAFALADAAVAGDPEARASIKLAMMYSGIASRQYSLAVRALGWLIGPDPRTGQIRDPGFLNRARDIRSLCGSDQHYNNDIIGQARQLVLAGGASSEPMALQAMALWGGGQHDRADALACASRLASNPKARRPWSGLHALMRQADAVKPSEGAEQESGLEWPEFSPSGLPFERPKKTPPPGPLPAEVQNQE